LLFLFICDVHLHFGSHDNGNVLLLFVNQIRTLFDFLFDIGADLFLFEVVGHKVRVFFPNVGGEDDVDFIPEYFFFVVLGHALECFVDILD